MNEQPSSIKRQIKKYANRRLYDTKSSSYITLDDIKEMVLCGESLIITEVKSEKDVTAACLLQIVLDQCSEDVPNMLHNEFLENLIKFYNHPASKQFYEYINQNMAMFLKQPNDFVNSCSSKEANPVEQIMDTVGEITKMNVNIWQNFFNNLSQEKT